MMVHLLTPKNIFKNFKNLLGETQIGNSLILQ